MKPGYYRCSWCGKRGNRRTRLDSHGQPFCRKHYVLWKQIMLPIDYGCGPKALKDYILLDYVNKFGERLNNSGRKSTNFHKQLVDFDYSTIEPRLTATLAADQLIHEAIRKENHGRLYPYY